MKAKGAGGRGKEEAESGSADSSVLSRCGGRGAPPSNRADEDVSRTAEEDKAPVKEHPPPF